MPLRGADCSLAAQFMRLVAVAHGQVSLQPATALVIYPKGAVTVASRRPGAAGGRVAPRVLGRHLISRAELTSTLTMWSGDAAEPVNVAATDLARQYGYLWRRLHGPVMLCRARRRGRLGPHRPAAPAAARHAQHAAPGPPAGPGRRRDPRWPVAAGPWPWPGTWMPC